MFNTYFSSSFVLEKNALVNLIFSDRSDGKTFDCKSKALFDYKINKEITIYIRRFKTEITPKLYETFFDDVIEKEAYKEFREWKFKGTRAGVKVSLDNGKNWDWIVFFFPLSMGAKLKSQLDGYISRIFTIRYDEAIPLDDKYLAKECVQLMEFYKSVDRDREVVRLIITGNRITLFNPFFDFWGIRLSITKEQIKLYKEDTVAVQIYVNEEHRQKREEGKFRKIVKGTEYEDYDSGGILKALNVKIMKRDNFTYWSSFKTEIGEGSIWFKNGQMVISEHKRQDGFLLTDKIYNTKREQYTCTFGRFPIVLKNIYRTGNMYFETERAFYIFEDILIKLGSH